MRWESLVSIQNLRLAWRRITTGKNLQHKRFFRDIYLVYETALDQNLRSLRQNLLAHAWKPSYVQRVYIPKPSGLQRPISFLGLEDQILLQAVANVFAKKLARKRKPFEYVSVFSNILSKNSDSIFFLERWQKTYDAFQKRCKTFFKQGNKWVANFDLAAYYDTISHDMLLRIVSPISYHQPTCTEVKKWLAVWSASNEAAITSHGIPQGPIASDFLAEAFFYPIDIELRKKSIKYVRYVDDIRLFGKSKNEVIKAGITLEQLCRDRGLIPQGKKFSISYATTSGNALGRLPSIPPASDGEGAQRMESKEAIRFLKSCVKGRPLKVIDKSRFRYVMYRAPRLFEILDIVLRLLPKHPEHIDAFVAYFSNYTQSSRSSGRIVKGMIEILRVGLPYTYVRGELWHLLARLGKKDQLDEALPLARLDARGREKCLGLSWGVMNFLIRCQEERLCRIGNRLQGELPLSRALLASRIPQAEYAPKRVIVSMLRGTLEEQLAAARQLQAKSFTLSQLNLRQRGLPQVCQNSLRSLGVIRRVSQAPRDWIAERLHQRFGGSQIQGWRSLLGGEYEHALLILIEADHMFDISSSNWLQLQDSFNDVVVRQFISFLRQRQLPGGKQSTIGRNGQLVNYGTLLDRNGTFSSAFPLASGKLRIIHRRRNRLPGSHPYDQRGGSQNRWLSGAGRDVLINDVEVALNNIITYASNHP